MVDRADTHWHCRTLQLTGGLRSFHRIYSFCCEQPKEQLPGEQQQQQQPSACTAVLLAACGAGIDVLERSPVVASADWSCLRMRASGADALPGCVPAADGVGTSATSLSGLPLDWRQLHSEAGLTSFLVVPIGPAARPWGALMLASRRFDDASKPTWNTYPRMAAVALVHQVRHWQTAAACAMLREAAATDDSIALIGVLLRVRPPLGAARAAINACGTDRRRRCCCCCCCCRRIVAASLGRCAPIR
jgi:hypothetical protein